jgi:polyhydroxybutyrate depolymerase
MDIDNRHGKALGGALLGWVGAILLVVSCSASGPEPSDGGIAEGSSAHSLKVGDLTREYRVYRPASITDPAPLVLVFHGFGGNAAMIQEQLGWDQAADRHGFVVVYPEGIEQAFNAGTCCGNAADSKVDDVAATHAMVDEVARTVPIDTDRLYAAGFSNGGMMSYRLACESDRFAAVGPVAGPQLVDCAEQRPISVMHIHGTADTVVSAEGNQSSTGIQVPPVKDVVADWRTSMACKPATETTAGNVRTSAAACPAGRNVDLIIIEGFGHDWPTSDDGLDATETLWQFFASHSR